ncbi:MAG: hypothetical protein V7K32_15120 [Nostoc sp.]|uniref:hypothetical protein n=1 Tax=Nostoc sp. TaxID=1180 RepID=UPI002FF5798B
MSALNMGRVRTPVPQENLGCFFICQSLMDNDLLTFLAAAGLLVLYLIFSALTEMGTKLPWKK